MSEARHPLILAGACLALFLGLLPGTTPAEETPGGAIAPPVETPAPVSPSPSASAPAPAAVPGSVVDSNSGDREAVLSPRLNPSATSSADAQALYADAVRKELQDGLNAALPLYEQVLQRDPAYIALYLRAGFAHIQAHEIDQAEALFKQGIAANPTSGELLAGLAFVRQSQSKLPEAFDLAQKAKALAPASLLAHRVAFESLRDQTEVPQALDLVHATLNGPALKADEWTALAHLYTDLVCATGEIPRDQVASLILPLYDKAFAFGNPSSELLRHRGDFAIFLDRKEEGYAYLKQASENGEPNAAIYLRLANLSQTLDKQDEALKYYERAYELEPEFPQLREVLALQYIRMKQEDKAIALLEETVRQSPTQASLYTSLGDLYSETNQLEKADFNYQQAINLGANQTTDYLKLAVVQIRENHLDDASKLLHDAESRFPDSPRIAFFEGVVQREMKKPDEALNFFAQAKILATDKNDDFLNGEYYYELSMAQEEAGQTGPSEASLKTGLTLEPNNENILNALAYFWADQNRNLKDALDYSQRANETAPDRGEFVDTLGWIYYRMGKYTKAAVLLQKAVVLTQEDPIVLGHLADAYLKLGRRTDAGEALHKLVEKDPTNADAQKKLENFLSGQVILSTKNVQKPQP